MDFKVSELYDIPEGLTLTTIKKFLAYWKRWHLNDTRAGCEHQREAKWEDERIDPAGLPKNCYANRDERGVLAIWVNPEEHPKGLLTKPCPTCGYRYGTAWLKEEVPQEVIDFLFSLPDTDIKPAWV